MIDDLVNEDDQQIDVDDEEEIEEIDDDIEKACDYFIFNNSSSQGRVYFFYMVEKGLPSLQSDDFLSRATINLFVHNSA